MLADPIEGMLGGIRSGAGRLFTAIVGTLLGFAVCVLPLPWREGILGVTVLAFTSIFQWAHYGGWFFVGLCAFVGLFAFIHAFAMERCPKFSFFAVFTCAAVYFAPVTFSGYSRLSSGTWRWSAAIYAVAAVACWAVPSVVARFLQRQNG